jgi:hypothetical protein
MPVDRSQDCHNNVKSPVRPAAIRQGERVPHPASRPAQRRASASTSSAAGSVSLGPSGESVPQRYPSNKDAIGTELVSAVVGNGKDPLFEAATDAQNKALGWLIEQLRQKFSLPLTEVFRHPQVSYKDSHEAETARW